MEKLESLEEMKTKVGKIPRVSQALHKDYLHLHAYFNPMVSADNGTLPNSFHETSGEVERIVSESF